MPLRAASFSTCLAAAMLVASLAAPVSAAPPVLKGRASEQGYVSQPHGAPGALNRDDIEGAGDPFSGGSTAEPVTEMLAPPEKPLAAGIRDEFAASQAARPPRQAAVQVEEDKHPAMQLAWDAWHKRVAEAIFNRWNFLANAAFKESPPLLVKVSYTVTREGQIQDVKFLLRSPDVMYNAITAQAINSISGDRALLAFPPGSRRLSVEKFADFCQNCGTPANKLRYTTGDTESVPALAPRK